MKIKHNIEFCLKDNFWKVFLISSEKIVEEVGARQLRSRPPSLLNLSALFVNKIALHCERNITWEYSAHMELELENTWECTLLSIWIYCKITELSEKPSSPYFLYLRMRDEYSPKGNIFWFTEQENCKFCPIMFFNIVRNTVDIFEIHPRLPLSY